MGDKKELEAEEINKYYNKVISSRGEDRLLDRLYSDRELRKNINLLEEGIPLLSKISWFINNNFINKKLVHIHNKLKDGIKDTLLIDYPSLDKVKNISGPVEIAYYYNKSLNKKIIYIGDIHDGYEFSCTDNKTIPIENYIDLLFKTDIEIDLFIEDSIPGNLKDYGKDEENMRLKSSLENLDKATKTDIKLEDIRINWDSSYLEEVIFLGERKYKKNKKNRIHFVDYRNDPNANEYLLHKDVEHKTPDEFKAFVKKNHDYIIAVQYYFKYNIIPKKEEKVMPEYLLKELIRADPENIQKIKPYILWLIDEYMSYYNNAVFPDLPIVQHQLNAKLSDIYVILRILKKDKIDPKKDQFNNCILHNGQSHGINIYTLLLILGFKFFNHIKSKSLDTCNSNPMTKAECDEVRCVKNIIPFDEFFSTTFHP
jgi:hypothetical protein